ncbi:MAG: hypothetical protein JWO31_4282 [Phycisphaerales bacterium]|nr:hypothetical protein [Phycisphaerales bacterium]
MAYAPSAYFAPRYFARRLFAGSVPPTPTPSARAVTARGGDRHAVLIVVVAPSGPTQA